MPHLLAAALCLVVVIEGLVLFAIPRSWQRMAYQALRLEPRTLRVIGGVAMAVGLLALHFMR